MDLPFVVRVQTANQRSKEDRIAGRSETDPCCLNAGDMRDAKPCPPGYTAWGTMRTRTSYWWYRVTDVPDGMTARVRRALLAPVAGATSFDPVRFKSRFTFGVSSSGAHAVAAVKGQITAFFAPQVPGIAQHLNKYFNNHAHLPPEEIVEVPYAWWIARLNDKKLGGLAARTLIEEERHANGTG